MYAGGRLNAARAGLQTMDVLVLFSNRQSRPTAVFPRPTFQRRPQVGTDSLQQSLVVEKEGVGVVDGRRGLVYGPLGQLGRGQ